MKKQKTQKGFVWYVKTLFSTLRDLIIIGVVLIMAIVAYEVYKNWPTSQQSPFSDPIIRSQIESEKAMQIKQDSLRKVQTWRVGK